MCVRTTIVEIRLESNRFPRISIALDSNDGSLKKNFKNLIEFLGCALDWKVFGGFFFTSVLPKFGSRRLLLKAC